MKEKLEIVIESKVYQRDKRIKIRIKGESNPFRETSTFTKFLCLKTPHKLF